MMTPMSSAFRAILRNGHVSTMQKYPAGVHDMETFALLTAADVDDISVIMLDDSGRFINYRCIMDQDALNPRQIMRWFLDANAGSVAFIQHNAECSAWDESMIIPFVKSINELLQPVGGHVKFYTYALPDGNAAWSYMYI